VYFYIDESGHTGPNLFDPSQPILYYGVLSSKVNVDILAAQCVKQLRSRCKKSRLHATELGNSGLVSIAEDLVRLQKKLDFRFDLYMVNKPDFSIISFFDQVFDSGVNPAVTWSGYWTPMRYVLLLRLATLFDQETALKAWEARIELTDTKSEAGLILVCRILRSRINKLADARSRQLISDVLEWAEQHPRQIHFNAKTKKDRRSVMPNIIGFQTVMMGIAGRLLRTKRRAVRMIVDQQSQFNRSQKTLADFYTSVRLLDFANGPGLPEVSFRGFPTVPIEFTSGNVSAGLELVDIYIWIFKRHLEGRDLSAELYALIEPQLLRGRTDEISLAALEKRWGSWFENLPEMTEEQLVKGKELMKIDESRRLQAIGKANS
jgi:Protein of unknown function (DUF3800)